MLCSLLTCVAVIRDEVLYINGGLQSYSNVNSTTGEKYGNLSYGISKSNVPYTLLITSSDANRSIRYQGGLDSNLELAEL